ncbi:hypothetical protein H6G36_29290 [Anabaena minutissima FACHB-250]|nr:hypothetical protein [Anabaena minutissima FACHB-250]
MNEKIVLDDTDVVSIAGDASVYNFGLASTFKSGELIESARKWIAQSGHETSSYSTWLGKNGIRCQLLRANGMGWKPGIARLRIEFIPDEPQPLIDPVIPSSDAIFVFMLLMLWANNQRDHQ